MGDQVLLEVVGGAWWCVVLFWHVVQALLFNAIQSHAAYI
jgi:hypothetical protein